jgi:hypothetical protein
LRRRRFGNARVKRAFGVTVDDLSVRIGATLFSPLDTGETAAPKG